MNRIVRFVSHLLMMPVRLVQILGTVVGHGLAKLFAPVSLRLDASVALSNLINSVSSSMATQRGLPLIVGSGLLLLSLVAHGAVLIILVASDSFGRNLYWLCIPFTLMHMGVMAGFTGAMLATPLGQGYKDK